MIAHRADLTDAEAGVVGIRFPAMACDAEIRIAGLEAAAARPLLDRAANEVRRIETKYSRYRPDSIVSRINAAAGSGEAIPVDSETADLLDFAASLHAQSDGLFDITSGILRQAWNFKLAKLPDPALLAGLCQRIGWQRVQWPMATGADPRAIALPETGMELDFGGFGKEYAADRAAGVLLAAGVRSGFVTLGGDIRVLGPRPEPTADGEGWWLGIQHPRDLHGSIAGVRLVQGGLATSGDYERYLDIDGQRYCHILDPRTGWPVRHWQSVSVVAPVCLAAGALSTIAMLMGEAAPDFLAEQAVPYLLVDANGQLLRAGL